jgi:hypothetical protein
MIKKGEQSTLNDWTGEQSKLFYFIADEVNELEIQLAKKHHS